MTEFSIERPYKSLILYNTYARAHDDGRLERIEVWMGDDDPNQVLCVSQCDVDIDIGQGKSVSMPLQARWHAPKLYEVEQLWTQRSEAIESIKTEQGPRIRQQLLAQQMQQNIRGR